MARWRAVRGVLRAALVAGVAAVTGVPAAQAGVSVSPQRVTLQSQGARVLIQRNPFRMSFAAGDGGAPALSEVPNTTLLPSPLAPTSDPVPPGVEPASSGQLYEPLSFLVGSCSVQQYPGSEWAGDLMSGVRAGVQYAARSVTRVARQGSGIQLTVSTNDPGRTLQVRIAPTGRGLVHVAVTPQPASGVAMVSDAFTSPSTEAFYGFGGRHNALNQRGQNLADWVQEENLNVSPSSTSPVSPASMMFPNGPTAAYYPQPQFISSRGYGFLVDQPQLGFLRIDSDRPDAWSVAADASSLSYIVAPGKPARAIADLTALTGRQPAPPAWALQPQLDRLVRNFTETTSDYESNVNSDLAHLRRDRLPLGAYRLEGWRLPGPDDDGLSLPSQVSLAFQRRVIDRLHRRHIHVLAYLRPWIVPGSAPDHQGLTVRDASGGTYEITGSGGSSYALLDFTKPAAVRFWARVIDRTLNLGFDGFMADYGEQVMLGMRFADGQTGATMHNRYPVLYMRATRRAVAAFERTHRRRRIWFFNRAGYSGSARYEGGNFPGDETTDYSQASGLASLAPDMLSRAIGGAYGYGTDIGGYFDYTTPPTTRQLFLRWAEWAALSPIFRLHGAGRTGTHTPWSFGAAALRTYRQLSVLHARAAPLIMQLWRIADRTGLPPTRPLWLQFPGDPRAAGQEQEWLLGPGVLVTPVVKPGARSLRAYFPRGCWREPQTGLRVRGPRYRTIPAPLGRLNFFFRCGTRPFRVSRL